MKCLKLRSYAKVNLGLWVNAKLTSGYHSLQTVFCLIDWYDEFKFEESKDVSLIIKGAEEGLKTNESNLCLKAVSLFQKEIKESKGIKITLKKNIPVGAGLGGGSSNAATVLFALNKLWEVNFSNEKLSSLAVQLGADVPFFIYQKKMAIAEGIGDKIFPINGSFPFPMVIAFPKVSVSTEWAFKNLNISLPKKTKKFSLLESISEGQSLSKMENDFEEIVMKSYPEIAKLKFCFQEYGAIKSILSGSGSAVFGIFESEKQAELCFSRLRLKFQSVYSRNKNFTFKIA